jgi:serine/threonine protein kinase/tetratricopeptide (TPR) repeat protein
MAYPPLPGLFAERYMIERELGHGATAVVYLAHDNKHDRQIALKVLSKDLAHALGPERFLREIHLTARLHHPHILPIFDSGEWNGLLYYVLPFVSGESLREKIDRENQLPIEECIRITCEVADALAHAHAHKIVHRDVKPENIMLSDGHALLADFGIARALDVHTGERLTSSGLIVGTSAYMSPEQAAGEEKIDARSDIYSLACVLYEMIAGVQAFTGPTTQSVIAQRFKHTPRPVSTYRPQVPEYVERALDKALAISPADRYAKIKDFADDLSDTPMEVRDRRRAPLRRAIREKQKAWGFAAAALVLITAAAVIANPPFHWSNLFRRAPALDSTKYVVVPSPSPGHSDIGAKDFDAAAKLNRALQKWNGLAVVDPEMIKDAFAGRSQLQSGDALDLAKRFGAGRLVRMNSVGDATVYDVEAGTELTEVSTDAFKGAADPYSSAALKLLAAKDRPRSASGGDGRTSSFAAWSAYGRAHLAMAKHDFVRAQTEFAAALKADDSYAPARLWSVQLAEWLSAATGRSDWKPDALRVAMIADSLAPRERLLAIALGELARARFIEACAAYSRLIAADSSDYAGWIGLGECQRLDPTVVRSRVSPSGYKFVHSFASAYNAFVRATQADPGAFELVGFERLRKLKVLDANTGRLGHDSSGLSYPAYPTLDHDTLAFVPYPMTAVALPNSALTTRRAALDRNASDLLAFSRLWVSALPKSSAGYEALATVLEARGEIDARSTGEISASDAIARALQFSSNALQRVRLRASEVRLRLKRSEFASGRLLADTLLQNTETDPQIIEELIPIAAATGRMSTDARFVAGSSFIPSDVSGVRVQPAIANAAARFLVHAALGDCSGATESARNELERLLSSYYSEREAAELRPALESRATSLVSPCTGGKSSLAAGATADRLTRMQQAFAAGDPKRLRSLLDSADARNRNYRPSDLSLDYTFQEAWLRAASGDTAAAIKQLDESLGALPSVGRVTLHELGGAAALGRAMVLRADLAAARGDHQTAKRYARNVVDLWANADSELQPIVARMRKLAANGI